MDRFCAKAVIPGGIDLRAPSPNALPDQGRRGLTAGQNPAYLDMQVANVQSSKVWGS